MIIIDEKEKLDIIYIRLDKLNQWSKNPKLHDIEKIIRSYEEFGFQDPGKLTKQLEENEVLVFGNGRAEAAIWMYKQNYDKPKGIAVDDTDGMWCLPVIFGNDFDNIDQAIAFALDHNLIGSYGGDVTHLDAVKVYDTAKYLPLAKQSIEYSVTADQEDLDLMENIIAGVFETPEEIPSPEIKTPSYSVKFMTENSKNEFIKLLKENSEEMSGEFLLRLLHERF